MCPLGCTNLSILYVGLRLSDTAVYTCKAVSETGETSWSAALIVEAPSNPSIIFHRTPEPSTFPGAPSKPAVSDITATSVRLTWHPNTNTGASPIHSYTVEYFSHDTGEVSVLLILFTAGVKWSVLPYLTKKLLPDINGFSVYFAFQHDLAPAHCTQETVDLLKRETPDFMPPSLWPTNSPDLNPVDNMICSVFSAACLQPQKPKCGRVVIAYH